VGDKKNLKSFSAKLLLVLALIGITAFYISQTWMGIAPIHKGDWSRGLPAVSLLEWQIFLACLFCTGMILAETDPRAQKIPHLDFWIAIAIWVFASVLWLSQPIVTNSAALEPTEPNFEIYPFNDSQTYDEFAQSALVGNGFGNRIPQRPLYIVFLIFMHVVVGQDYANVIALQSLIFALFPVLLYLFGRAFFGRPLGISIAILAILRDVTSNLVSPFTGNLSYSKLYLSEIPTAMLLILFLWVGIRWIRSGFPMFAGFIMGGVLGVAMLIRTQVVVAIPVILLIALLQEPKKLKLLFRNVVLMMTVILLIVAPWLWRNWRLTGSVIFDSPESQTINLALRYSRLNGVEPEALPLPGESNREYNERLKQMTREAILSNPLGAIKGVFSSFLNHCINNVLVFPLQNDVKSFAELFTPADAFWEEWEGTPTTPQLVLILFYLFLLGLGVSVAWHKNGWIGLLPLALNLAYNLWTSLALLSGQRFMLTMDWSIYLYYMLGLFALLSVFFFTLERGRAVIVKWYEANSVSSPRPFAAKGWQHYVLAGALFAGVGVSLPLMEKVFPRQYPISQSQIIQTMLESPALYKMEPSAACLQEFLTSDDVSFRTGRALYPRYYEANSGEFFTDSFGYKAVDEGRMVFTLLQGPGDRVVFPMNETPSFFPHASDVTLVYGKDDVIWFAFVKKGEDEAFYVSSNFDTSLCK
jgi:4-amino-4-deoxy-L-arabinose transferase-like glycosyltransferase